MITREIFCSFVFFSQIGTKVKKTQFSYKFSFVYSFAFLLCVDSVRVSRLKFMGVRVRTEDTSEVFLRRGLWGVFVLVNIRKCRDWVV